MLCSPSHKLARQNAKQVLEDEGLIDKYNNVLDYNRLVRRVNQFNAHTKDKYGIDAKMVHFENAGSGKVIFNDSAFRAIDVLNGTVKGDENDRNTQNYLNQTQPHYSPAFNPEEVFGSSLNQNDDNIPRNGLTRLVSLKESLLKRAKNTYSKIKPQLEAAKDDIPEYNRLIKLQAELKDYIFGNDAKGVKGLQNEISEMSKVDSRSPEIIAPYVEKEIERLDTLVKSTDPANTAEAKDIIDFMHSMADFNPVNIARSPNGHPLYDTRELYDENGNFLLTPAMVKPFKDWDNIATDYEDKLAVQNRNIVENIFNNNGKIQAMYNRSFTYDDIVNAKKGMKDINWLDMMVMDISSGIFSHNGLMPQVVKNLVDNSLEKQYSWSQKVKEDTDKILPKITTELKRLGYTMSRLGFLGINDVDYGIFRQSMPDETQFNNNIATKYSYKYLEGHDAMESRLDRTIKEAYQQGDDTSKTLKFRQAYNSRNRWIKAYTAMIDPSLVKEISENPEFSSLADHFNKTPEDQAAHEQKIKDLVGDDHYKKVVESQKKKLGEYVAQKENFIHNLFSEEGVDNVDALTDKSQRQIQVWEAQNNPFKSIEYLNSNSPSRIGTNDYHSNLDYNEYVPLKQSEGKDLGFYDKNYAIIEKNPILKEFHDLLSNTMQEMYSRFDYDEQDRLSANSVPNLQRSMREIFLDKNTTFFQAISKVYRKGVDGLKGSFGINQQDQLNFAKVNPNTGLPDYKVNDGFIKQNERAIQNLFTVKAAKFKQEAKIDVSRNTIINEKNLSSNVMRIINKFTGREYTSDELVAQYGSNIPVGKIIYNNAQHELAQNLSFDLPKVLKLYSHLTAEYTARKEMLPMVELMRNHYEGIKNQVTQNTGDPRINAETGNNQLNGLRTNAIKQFDNWFQRVVLGNTNLKKQYGLLKRGIDMTPEEKEGFLNKYFGAILNGTKFDGKIFDAQEKNVIKQIDSVLSNLSDSEEDKATRKELEKIKGSMGKDLALSATVDNMLNYTRIKGLGYNLSAGLTSFIVGQVSNSIMASSGMYFPHEFIDTITPTDLVAADVTKQFRPGAISEKVAKAYYMAKMMDVLQDRSNELQKASSQSAFSNVDKFNPYYLIMKGEHYTQIPLMAATLKDHAIEGSNGEKSNVWDAMQGKYDPESKQWSFQLKPEFATSENKKNWNDFNGDEYFDYKSKIRTIIKNARGDFDPTSGMMAKSSQAGQAVLMYKSWLPREFYKRFATTQDDLHTGVEGFKGTYQSHTAVTGAMQGGLTGAFFFGPIGAAAGAAFGGALGHFYGAESQIGIMNELIQNNKILFKKLAGMPVNYFSRLAGKGDLIDTRISDSQFKNMQSKDFTKQDFNNFRSNMQSMAVQFTWMGLLLLTKSIFWDDKDKADSTARMTHNLLANRFIQLAGESTMYTNAVETGTTVLTIPVLKFLQNSAKTVEAFDKFMKGQDIQTAGPNAGHSRLLGSIQKNFIPGIGSSSYAGFGAQMKEQYTPSPIDDYFHGEERETKEQTKEAKASRRLELEQQLEESIPDEDARHTFITKQLNKEFPRQKSLHSKLAGLYN